MLTVLLFAVSVHAAVLLTKADAPHSPGPVSAAYPASVRINIASDKVNRIILDLMPFILSTVKTTPVPGIEGSYLGLDYKVSGITFSNLQVPSCQVSFADKSLGVKLALVLALDLSWQYGKWGVGSSGRATASANGTVTAAITLGSFIFCFI